MHPEILIQAALVVFCHSVFWFILSLVAKRNDVADIAWGQGFILIVLFLSLIYSTNDQTKGRGNQFFPGLQAEQPNNQYHGNH